MSNDKSQMGPKTERRWYEAKMGDQQGLIISEVTGENIAVTYKKENAAFIVKACNLHDEIVEACQMLIDRLNYHGSIDPIREEGPIEDLKNLIAKAKGA
jgi:hypothetical protein